MRGLSLERGHVMAQGHAKLTTALAELLDGERRVLAPRIHELIVDMRRQWIAPDERIKAFDAEFAAAKAQDGAMALDAGPFMRTFGSGFKTVGTSDGPPDDGNAVRIGAGATPRRVTLGKVMLVQDVHVLTSLNPAV